MGSHLGAVGELSSEIWGASLKSESRNLYSRTMPAALHLSFSSCPSECRIRFSEMFAHGRHG
jgi:hypothetical protein